MREMKDSGIEWISIIPSDWKIMPNKYLMWKKKCICPVYNGEDIISLSMNAGINGIPEDHLTKKFDKEDYQVLLVANKYQTGFDQPKLCAMYVMKKLSGVNAVQTLSRLNRICPPYKKKTFILDFMNGYEDITNAFAPFYTTTLLSNSVTPSAIYDIEAQIDAYAVIDPDDIQRVNEILYKEKITAADKKKINFCLEKSQRKYIQH